MKSKRVFIGLLIMRRGVLIERDTRGRLVEGHQQLSEFLIYVNAFWFIGWLPRFFMNLRGKHRKYGC